jgi:hypothetical protein
MLFKPGRVTGSLVQRNIMQNFHPRFWVPLPHNCMQTYRITAHLCLVLSPVAGAAASPLS